MPAATINSENRTKHLTQAEAELRQQAEREVIPQRKKLKLKKPAFVARNKRANAYWNQILKRMEGLVLLDDLDSEMLAGYCSMLARRDQTILLVNDLYARLGVSGAVEPLPGKKPDGALSDEEWERSAQAPPDPMTPDELIEAVSKLDTMTGKLQALERNLLQYAEKLGLTPSGRVRLAQKRAAAAAENKDPGGDLVGD